MSKRGPIDLSLCHDTSRLVVLICRKAFESKVFTRNYSQREVLCHIWSFCPLSPYLLRCSLLTLCTRYLSSDSGSDNDNHYWKFQKLCKSLLINKRWSSVYVIMWRWWGLEASNDKVQIAAFAEYRKRHLETGRLQTVRDRTVRNIMKHIISNLGTELVLAKVTQNNNSSL